MTCVLMVDVSAGFTRMVLSLWAMTMLSLYIRVQVNILGRHLYIDTARGGGSSHLLVRVTVFSMFMPKNISPTHLLTIRLGVFYNIIVYLGCKCTHAMISTAVFSIL